MAGCPPDAFSADGQLWGNPLFRWDVMKKDSYSWWTCLLYTSANQVNDVQPVAWSDVVGVPVFDIPVLGYPASFLGTAQGKFCLLYTSLDVFQ